MKRIFTGITAFIENIPHFHMTKEDEIVLLTSLREIIKDIDSRGASPAMMLSPIDIALYQRKGR